MTRTKIPDALKKSADFLPAELGIEISNHRSSVRYGLSFHPAPQGLDWTLHLKVPRGTSPEKIREILYRHRRWINSRFQKFRQAIVRTRGDRTDGCEEHKGPVILFNSLFHRIIVERCPPGTGGEKVFINHDQTIVVRSAGEIYDHEAALAVRDHFLSEMVRRTLGILESRSRQLNLYPKRVVIRNTKRQWGSMSRHGVMSLSLRLAQMTSEVLDLVIVHELCHMLHPNHGESFNALLDELTPDHRRLMKEVSAITLAGSDSLWESGFSSFPIAVNILPKPHQIPRT